MPEPARRCVLDDPHALDSRLHRQPRDEILREVGQELLIPLSDGGMRDDLVELTSVRQESREGLDESLGQRDERFLRLGPQVKQACEPRLGQKDDNGGFGHGESNVLSKR